MDNNKLKFGGEDANRVKTQLDEINKLTIGEILILKKKIKDFGELMNIYGEGNGFEFIILSNSIEINNDKSNFIKTKQDFALLVNSTLE